MYRAYEASSPQQSGRSESTDELFGVASFEAHVNRSRSTSAFVYTERIKFRRAILDLVKKLRAASVDAPVDDAALKAYLDEHSAECLPTIDFSKVDESAAAPVAVVAPSDSFQFRGDVQELLTHLRSRGFFDDQIRHHRVRSGHSGYFGPDMPSWIPSILTEALMRSKNISRLYSHQHKAVNDLRDGNHVVVSTSTASGKSLVFNIPVLTSLLESGCAARSFFIFPTKALGQDQTRALRELINAHESLSSIKVSTFDGDTPAAARDELLESTHVFMINPDILHHTILPQHSRWGRVLGALRFIVLDEVHTYSGVFGSHVALVLRRLRRLCTKYGNTSLQFICCSATIGNPVEHTVALTGVDPSLVKLSARDGAPMGNKHFVIWQPPPTPPAGPRNSPSRAIMDAVKLMETFVLAGVRTLMFCTNRKSVEYVTSLVHKSLAEHTARPNDVVRSYRSGYSPEVRREIEAQLFGGHLRGVVSTSALELGVDIGMLDAVIHVSFPPSVSSLWQQAGRAGRRQGESLSMLVADTHPADTYIVEHPEFMFDGAGESVQIDPFNPFILAKHLDCAAYEMPLDTQDDALFFGEDIAAAASDKLLVVDGGRTLRWNPRHAPPRFSLRTIEDESVLVVEAGTKAVLEDMEYSRALLTVYPGAVFYHQVRSPLLKYSQLRHFFQGRSYVVIDISFMRDSRTPMVVVERRDVNYVTFCRDIQHVDPLQTLGTKGLSGNVTVVFGHVKVTAAILGYKKVTPFTNAKDEYIEYANGTIPPYISDTTATWVDSAPLRLYLNI